jgi:PmbA protein
MLTAKVFMCRILAKKNQEGVRFIEYNASMDKQAKLQQVVHEMLARAKSSGAEQAEVSASMGSGFNVEVRMGDVESIEYHDDQSIYLTVYCGQAQGTASTVDIRAEAIESTVRAAIEIAKSTQADPCNGLADRSMLAFHYPDLDLFHPWSITPEEAVERALHCETRARNADKRITNSEGVSFSTGQTFYVYGNSEDFIGFYPSTEHHMSCSLIAKEQQDMQRDYSYTVAIDPQDLVSGNALADEAVEKTVKRLQPRSLKTCRVPVIFSAEVARGLMGHFVQAISGHSLYRDLSFLCGKMGEKIFPAWMQVREEPHMLKAIGSQAFDEDGVATQAKHFIKDGCLISYALGVYSARKLGMHSTGNADGVHNLIVEPGEEDLVGLVKQMQRGLLVTELMGQGANIVTGDYSRGAAGFWVENGIIQYPVHQITIAGNLKEMFGNIVAVGKDVDIRGNIRTGSILLEEMTLAGE